MPTAFFLLNVALNHESDVIQQIKSALGPLPSLNFEIQSETKITLKINLMIASEQNRPFFYKTIR